jgi:hypothetical protein
MSLGALPVSRLFTPRPPAWRGLDELRSLAALNGAVELNGEGVGVH